MPVKLSLLICCLLAGCAVDFKRNRIATMDPAFCGPELDGVHLVMPLGADQALQTIFNDALARYFTHRPDDFESDQIALRPVLRQRTLFGSKSPAARLSTQWRTGQRVRPEAVQAVAALHHARWIVFPQAELRQWDVIQQTRRHGILDERKTAEFMRLRLKIEVFDGQTGRRVFAARTSRQDRIETDSILMALGGSVADRRAAAEAEMLTQSLWQIMADWPRTTSGCPVAQSGRAIQRSIQSATAAMESGSALNMSVP